MSSSLSTTIPVLDQSIARDGVVEQPDQECDGARDVDEGIKPVDVHHEAWVGHEELLNRHFPEDVQILLHLDDL
jgi:hypothetical protein